MTAAAAPRPDRVDAAAWLGLGAAVLAGSVAMDRLEEQDVPPFAAPGLLPGLLGLLLLLFGGLLLLRTVRRTAPDTAAPSVQPPARALLVIGLCVLFGTVLVGHGLPFWAAAAAFVAIAIPLLRQGDRPPLGPRTLAAAFAPAVAIGLAAGGAITLVFERIFLVRLP